MSQESPPATHRFPWKTAILGGVIVILGALALVAYLLTLRSAGEAVSQGAERLHTLATNAITIAERFQTAVITRTFRQGIPQVTSSGGDILELASARSDETFTHADSWRVAWDWIYLGTTEAEIRVPVTFRYHLRLSDSWRLATRDQVCLVLAPPIRPTLPPAIHIDRMEKRAESGWARFDKQDRLRDLEKSMSATLEERARDPVHMALVREACRQSVAAFVRNWLIREDHWRSDRFTSIIVVFPDEVAGGESNGWARTPRVPTIRLEEATENWPDPPGK